MKSTVAIVVFAIGLAFDCFAQKIAFIGDRALWQANSAIFNGAKNTAAELSKSGSKGIEIVYLPTPANEAEQIRELGRAYLDGFSAAIIVAVEKSELLDAKISELARSGFLSATVGGGSRAGLVCVGTDSKKLAAALKEFVAKASQKAEIFCYFSGEKERKFDITDSSELSGKLGWRIGPEAFKDAFSGRRLSAFECRFYSEFAAKNSVEILRRDNYCEVFFNPSLLSDLRPIKPDGDREFIICVGALPIMEYYLQTSQIDCCISDDFYGWGVYSLRALVEELSKPASKRAKFYKSLPPIITTKENSAGFSRDWKNWLK